jgi:hypothetical protein
MPDRERSRSRPLAPLYLLATATTMVAHSHYMSFNLAGAVTRMAFFSEQLS